MPRAIFNEPDQSPPGTLSRSEFVEYIADRFNNAQIFNLGVATYIVSCPDLPPLANHYKCANVILDMEPIPHIAAIAVDRQ